MSDEKTEEPTQKKLRDSRQKGQVANSKEVVSAAVVLAVAMWFYFGFYDILEAAMRLVTIPAQYYLEPFDSALEKTFHAIWDEFIRLCFPIVLAAAAVAILANYFQVGPIFSFEPLTPKMEKIDPVKGFKRIFAMKNFVEFLKSVMKVSVLAIVCYAVIKQNLGELLKIPICKVSCIPMVLGQMMFQLVAWALLAFGIIAVADVLYQNYQHKKDLRMSKDEVKREYKDSEGNPEIKGKRKQIHREILNDGGGTKEGVKKSTVVVTNPTHVAVGLRYKSEEKKLPLITVKGESVQAEKIKEIAYEEDIPVMENVDLARLLYDEGEEECHIPQHLLQPVAEVIRWVNDLRKERGEGPV